MNMKKKMTYEQHVEAGKLLKQVREALQPLFIQVANAYPCNGHGAKAMKALSKAVTKIDTARSELEELAFRDCGLGFSLDIYYGNKQGSHGQQL
jgi:hypothetical protein